MPRQAFREAEDATELSKLSQQVLDIIIPDRVSGDVRIEEGVCGPGYRILAPGAVHPDEIQDEVWEKVVAVLAWHDLDYDRALLAKLHSCRVLVRVGVGFDNVDLAAAAAQDIKVCNVPDYGTEDVADHAFALLLALARGLPAFNDRVREDREAWDWEMGGDLHRLRGSTLGIVGLGRIGTATALRAKPFGIDVAFCDPYVPDGMDKALGLTRHERLEELLAASHLISLHVPLTAETRRMVDGAFLSAIRRGTILVNTARGGILDLDAIHAALRDGRLRAVGLDVLPEEPPPPSHPLIRAWRNREEWLTGRILITPHAAFYCKESFEEMRRKAAQEALRVLEGHTPRNWVNRRYFEARGGVSDGGTGHSAARSLD